MSYSEAARKVESIEKSLRVLTLIDWDEIFEFVPNSEEVKQEINDAIVSISKDIIELDRFFQ